MKAPYSVSEAEEEGVLGILDPASEYSPVGPDAAAFRSIGEISIIVLQSAWRARVAYRAERATGHLVRASEEEDHAFRDTSDCA